jgi:hypothetical protein
MSVLGFTSNPAFNTPIIVIGAHCSIKIKWKLYLDMLGDEISTQVHFLAEEKEVLNIVNDPHVCDPQGGEESRLNPVTCLSHLLGEPSTYYRSDEMNS